MISSFWFAFSLTLLAGLSTGIGALIAFVFKKGNARFLSVALGFSAGVMIYISFGALLPEAQELLKTTYTDEKIIGWIVISAFFAGIIGTALIDMFIPSPENPHELHQNKKELTALKDCRHNPKKLMRMGLFTAFALAAHNFPEGIATFMSALTMPTIAYSIAFAVALHNIPEGIAVSAPIFYATGSRKKAFFYSFLSGLTEPIGAVIGYFILKPFMSDTLLGTVFAGVAGIMVYISLDELLPAAKEYGEHHLAMIGLFVGMAIMATSLVLLGGY